MVIILVPLQNHVVEIEEEDDEIDRRNNLQNSEEIFPRFYTQVIHWNGFGARGKGSSSHWLESNGVGFAGENLGYLLTLSSIRYHVPHAYMHYGWLVGLFALQSRPVHITAQQYRRYS